MTGGRAGAAEDAPAPDLLERRRRRAIRGVLAALAVGVLGLPVALAIGEAGEGSENWEAVAGAFVYVAIGGLIAAPAIVRAWQRSVERRVLEELAAERPEVRYIGDGRGAAARDALASESFDFAAFKASGLAEPFESVRVEHVLAGRSGGVPFALAALRLLNGRGFRVFRGVLAGFRLARPRPGLTIVARDRGLLGNILARAGSGIERVSLEDPGFEGVFEAYGTDQVQARVALTTTMLERLKHLDELAHARGFTCAFSGGRLMFAFRGMRLRPGAWWIAQPAAAWLPAYRRRLGELVDLPARIAVTLDLAAEAAGAAAAVPARAARPAGSAAIAYTDVEVLSAGVFRFIGEAGVPLVRIASGTLVGGLAGFFGWMGLREGLGPLSGWYAVTMIGAGLAYGAYALLVGLVALARLAWTWGAPLRGIPDRATGAGPPPGPSAPA